MNVSGSTMAQPAADARPPAAPAADERLSIVVLGLTLRSSWGNGHATTYRALIRALAQRGHRVLFLERDKPWYASSRDHASLPGKLALYDSLEQLEREWRRAVERADLVIVGSFVPEGVRVGDWAQATARGTVAFYDIDTPVTLDALRRGDCEYLEPRQIADYDLYLSFTGGPTLQRIENEYGAPCARPLYCAVDAARYRPLPAPARHDLGYMGTYSADRQPGLDRLLLEPARRLGDARFVVAGAGYPDDVRWPANVERIEHVGTADHRAFYAGQRYTLNLTRAAMTAAGWSPSVRLFEAAACATPIVSDFWAGLDAFFEPGEEILIAGDADDVVRVLRDLPEAERRRIGEAARRRVLREHTAARRAEALERYVAQARSPMVEEMTAIG